MKLTTCISNIISKRFNYSSSKSYKTLVRLTVSNMQILCFYPWAISSFSRSHSFLSENSSVTFSKLSRKLFFLLFYLPTGLHFYPFVIYVVPVGSLFFYLFLGDKSLSGRIRLIYSVSQVVFFMWEMQQLWLNVRLFTRSFEQYTYGFNKIYYPPYFPTFLLHVLPKKKVKY